MAHPHPEKTIDAFADELAKAAFAHGWMLARTVHDGSDRAFHAIKDGNRINFLVKLSQTETGFWGLQPARADEMVKSAWHLVLLTAATRGYVVKAAHLRGLLTKVSRTADGGIRINERDVKGTPYSSSADAIWSRLK